jgi:hypothetical protein
MALARSSTSSLGEPRAFEHEFVQVLSASARVGLCECARTKASLYFGDCLLKANLPRGKYRAPRWRGEVVGSAKQSGGEWAPQLRGGDAR